MALTAALAEEHYDSLIGKLENQDVITHSYPIAGVTTQQNCDNSVGLDYFGFLKDVEKKKTRVYAFFDLVQPWQEPDGFKLDDWVELIKKKGNQKVMELPDGLRPAEPLPNGATMSIVVVPARGENPPSLLKYIVVLKPITGAQALRLVVGKCLCSPWRPDTLGSKKAVMSLLCRLEGKRWLYASLKERQIAEVKSSSKSSWEPSAAELAAGMAFINSKAKYLGISDNQQFLWVLTNVRDPASPIYGWPEGKVEKACANLARGKSQADYETFYPLCIMDLKRVWYTKILPLVVPYLASFGLLVAGAAGKGKTQVAKMLAKALGTWRIESNSELMDFVSGWRRGSQIDVFRDTPGTLWEGILLDDPHPGIDCLCVELLKAFLDVGESSLCDARYTPAKFEKNQFRTILCNDWKADLEPSAHSEVNDEKFQAMIGPVFGSVPEAHKMAVLKRAVTVVAGNNAVYVRLPSQHTGQKIHVFREDGVADDWLSPTNKKALAAYRDGREVEYDGFGANVKRQQELIHQWMLNPIAPDAHAEPDAQEHESRWRDAWQLTAEEAEAMIKKLQDENAALKQQEAMVKELQRENAALKQQLELLDGVEKRRKQPNHSLDDPDAAPEMEMSPEDDEMEELPPDE